jgi:hypothetical protein
MTTPPRKWATDAAYSSGPDVGTPPRDDPGAGIAAQGFVPHEGVPAQHVNSLFGEIIDFLHSPLDQADAYCELREDFMPGTVDTSAGVVYADHTWLISENPSAAALTTMSTSIPFPGNNPGLLFANVSANDSFEISLGAELTTGFLKWGDLTAATFCFGVSSTNFTGAEAFVGLASQLSDNTLGDDAVGLWFRKATSNFWMIRHKVGGADDATLTSVPVVDDEMVVCKLLRISATQVQVYLNGALAATLTDGTTAPADTARLNLGMIANAGSGAALVPQWDLAHVRFATPNRAT